MWRGEEAPKEAGGALLPKRGCYLIFLSRSDRAGGPRLTRNQLAAAWGSFRPRLWGFWEVQKTVATRQVVEANRGGFDLKHENDKQLTTIMDR